MSPRSNFLSFDVGIISGYNSFGGNLDEFPLFSGELAYVCFFPLRHMVGVRLRFETVTNCACTSALTRK